MVALGEHAFPTVTNTGQSNGVRMRGRAQEGQFEVVRVVFVVNRMGYLSVWGHMGCGLVRQGVFPHTLSNIYTWLLPFALGCFFSAAWASFFAHVGHEAAPLTTFLCHLSAQLASRHVMWDGLSRALTRLHLGTPRLAW